MKTKRRLIAVLIIVLALVLAAMLGAKPLYYLYRDVSYYFGDRTEAEQTVKGFAIGLVILLVFYKLRTKEVQVMSLYNNGQISKEEAEAALLEKYGPAGEVS